MKNLQQPQRSLRSRRSTGARRSASDVAAGKDECWGCGQPSHFLRDCLKAQTRPGETATATTTAAGVAAASTSQDQGNEH